jgi:hypothetical protein
LDNSQYTLSITPAEEGTDFEVETISTPIVEIIEKGSPSTSSTTSSQPRTRVRLNEATIMEYQ